MTPLSRSAALGRPAVLGAAAVLLGLLTAGCGTAPARPSRPAKPQHVVAARSPSTLTSLAEVALEKGDCRAASEDYARAARQGSKAVARRASQVAITCQDLPAAWASAQRWRSLAPHDQEASLVYGTLALALYHIPEARAALAPLVKGSGPKAEREELSLIELLSEDPDIGANTTLAALGGTVDAHSPAVILTAFGALALEAYHFDLAGQRAEQALAEDARSGSALRLLARVHVLQGDAGGAILAAREAMKADPRGSTLELADVLTGLDRLDDARAELERLLSAGVSASVIDSRLAVLAFQSGDMAEAERRFSELVGQGAASGSAYLYLGEIAARAGDQRQALTDYRQLSETPLALTADTRSAGILLDQGKRNQALGVFDGYESEHPEDAVDVALAKADLLADHGDAKSGLGFIEAALERFPGFPRLEYERATLLERTGQVEASVRAFEQLLRERPGDPNLMNALGYTLADHRLDLGRAESLIRRALAAAPDNPAILDSLGWVRLRRGDARGALPYLERAYAISRDPQIAAHWGEALWRSGEKSQARKVWSGALARNPDSKALKDTMHRLVHPGRG